MRLMHFYTATNSALRPLLLFIMYFIINSELNIQYCLSSYPSLNETKENILRKKKVKYEFLRSLHLRCLLIEKLAKGFQY
mgnify:CR=1 FL=1